MSDLKKSGYPLQIHPEVFMNSLPQSYSELAEETNTESLPNDSNKKTAKIRALFYLINQTDSKSMYVKIPTSLHLLLDLLRLLFHRLKIILSR